MKAKSFYIRWTLNERFQHWALAISFIVLVITGFQLKYPDAWWARLLVGGEWLFDLRGLLHRIAGTVMLLFESQIVRHILDQVMDIFFPRE